ncbi:MAG: phosphoribosylformylglycinamidine synthase subunit PurQ [bacterium]
MSKIRAGVVVFPGTNCDRDTYHALQITGFDADYVWYERKSLKDYQLVVIPGGFSYGDYLRAGALARFSPIMETIKRYIEKKGLVLGICNGFQILLEAMILPGAMLRNTTLKFICRDVYIRVERTDTPFTSLYKKGEVIRIPIAHAEGNYYGNSQTIDQIERKKQVVFRYVDEHGNPTEYSNPNGSINNIAGICNADGNVLAMMPHPERASEMLLGSEDGKRIFVSIKKALS